MTNKAISVVLHTLSLFVLCNFIVVDVSAQQCTTSSQCFAACCPSGAPVCSQTCRNTCASYPATCDNPNGVPYTVWRPSNGSWYEIRADGVKETTQWGLNGDLPLKGKYAKEFYDDTTNQAVLKTIWRPLTGNWFSCFFTSGDTGCNNSSNVPYQFGLPGDYPLVGDIDGDGFNDPIVWRPSNGTWYYTESSTHTAKNVQWGLPGDYPLTSDLDGDENADLVVWRKSTGTWYALLSSNNYSKATNLILIKQWGLPSDHPMQGDYDLDGKADLVVWRPKNGVWYMCRSSLNFDCTQSITNQFGLPGDKPIQHDFDGDGKSDYSVWRPSTGTWYHMSTLTGITKQIQWGLKTDLPEDMGIVDQVDYLY